MKGISERQLTEELAARFRMDVERAREDLQRGPRSHPSQPARRNNMTFLVIALAAVMSVPLIGAYLLGRSSGAVGALATAQDMLDSPTAETPPSSATTRPTLIELVDGLPLEVDGEPVLRGDAAVAAILNASAGTRLLVGGWIFGETPMSCPAMRPGEWWNPCNAVGLHSTAFNGPITFVYRTSAGLTTPILSAGQTSPIVLAVHVQDDSCPPGRGCEALPVMDAVVWSGDASAVPSNFPGKPAGGLSQDRAVDIARGFATAQADGTVELVTATAGPFGSQPGAGNDVSADRWVWAFVFAGHFPNPGCASAACGEQSTMRVVIDFATGSLIVEQAPA